MITLPTFAKISHLTHGFSTSLPDQPLVQAEQVHSATITLVDASHAGQTIPGADGLITDTPNLTLTVRTADCLPVLFYDPPHQTIGIIHAGWKGVAGKIHLQAVRRLTASFSSQPPDLLVGLGPGICAACYHRHIDLVGNITHDLIQAGVNPANLYCLNHCTYEDKQLPSHQRSLRTGEPQGKLYGFLIRH